MRLSQLFGRTLRRPPAEAETPSHQLLLRAGLVQQLSAGVYSYLPLGWRVLRKIEQVLREEMDAAGGQEVMMPALQPRELWQESGRDESMDGVLFRVTDNRERDFVLGPTHEEVAAELFRRQVQSYRELPVRIYQVQQKFRDEPRPRGGLIRLRQFTMKDLYSFDADWEGLDASYHAMAAAYRRVFDRCGVPTVAVEADSGTIGGRDSQEFMFLTGVGEDEVLLCEGCGYAANAEKAEFRWPAAPPEEALPVEEVATPGVKTIEDLARFLRVPTARTVKAVFYEADGRPAFVCIRGDLAVNETKLARALGAAQLALMDEPVVRAQGLVAGSASAVGLPSHIRVVADRSAVESPNLIGGANRPDAHLRNLNHGRDWTADVVADIALARDGDPCARCEAALRKRRAIEMGHVFKIGTGYSERLNVTFLDRDGTPRHPVMGSYGIGTERLLAAVVEANHDERGIVWPRELAPYDVHLVALNIGEAGVRDAAERLYGELQDTAISALYDDRDESAGVKFNDADLLGMPLRVTVSPRGLKSRVVELKHRHGGDPWTVPAKGAVPAIREALADAATVK